MYSYKTKSVHKNTPDLAFPRTLPTAMVMLGQSVSVQSRTNPGIYTPGESANLVTFKES